jgi:hypothetical protein
MEFKPRPISCGASCPRWKGLRTFCVPKNAFVDQPAYRLRTKGQSSGDLAGSEPTGLRVARVDWNPPTSFGKVDIGTRLADERPRRYAPGTHPDATNARGGLRLSGK